MYLLNAVFAKCACDVLGSAECGLLESPDFSEVGTGYLEN